MKIRVVFNNGEYAEGVIDGRYDLGTIASNLNEARPDAIVKVGKTLLVRAGKVKTISLVDEEVAK